MFAIEGEIKVVQELELTVDYSPKNSVPNVGGDIVIDSHDYNGDILTSGTETVRAVVIVRPPKGGSYQEFVANGMRNATFCERYAFSLQYPELLELLGFYHQPRHLLVVRTG